MSLNTIQYNHLNKKNPTINIISKNNSLVKFSNHIQSNHLNKKILQETFHTISYC